MIVISASGMDSMADGTSQVDKESITINFSESVHIPGTGLEATVS